MPVAVVENGQTYYIRTDHIGRPVFATDATGAKVWEVSYLPFGGVHVATTTTPDLRFPGQWFQSESGLHQNWMRDYDPTTGRYMQADPLGLVDGASVYGYARQNPGRYTDPRGEYAIGAACIGPQAVYCLAGAAAVGIGIYLYLQQVDDLNFCPLDFFDNPIVNSEPPEIEIGPDGKPHIKPDPNSEPTGTETGVPPRIPPEPPEEPWWIRLIILLIGGNDL